MRNEIRGRLPGNTLEFAESFGNQTTRPKAFHVSLGGGCLPWAAFRSTENRRVNSVPVNTRCSEDGEGFPGGSDGKESACNVGDPGSVSEWGRSPGGGHGNPSPVFWPYVAVISLCCGFVLMCCEIVGDFTLPCGFFTLALIFPLKVGCF